MPKQGQLISCHDMLDIQKTWIKHFEVCFVNIFKHLHFKEIEFQIMTDGQKVNFIVHKYPIDVNVVSRAILS